ncbi:MAG: transketolase [Patescibacteria group bacterium]
MSFLSDQKIKELNIKANEIRQDIIKMLAEAGSGHTAGALGMTDIFTLFYFHILKHNPKDSFWPDRDILVLSNGHICPVLYATFAHAGYFGLDELQTLRKFGSRLQGHPHREFLKFSETSSGPLGSGLSQAVGMALADKIDKKDKERFIYCFMSDGELDEGNSWEGMMLAGKNKLNNLIAVIDKNNIQIDGKTDDVMPLEILADKFKSFNWNVLEVSGHDFKKLNEIVEEAKECKNKPTVIIAKTIPGKGIKKWENDYKWHGKAPSKKEAEEAIKELEISKPV